MKRINKSIISVAVAAAMSSPMMAMATNGILPLGNGMVAHGMGGAGIANGAEAMSGVDNPALVSRTSNQWAVAASLFMPYRSADFGTGTGYVESDSNLFVIPQGGFTMNINDKFDGGVLVYAMGGMNTDYPADKIMAGLTGSLGMDLKGVVIAPTISMDLADKHSIGLSVLFGYEKMETNLQTAMGMPPSESDSATGFGFKLGYVGNVAAGTSIGVTYQSKIKMSEMDAFCDTGQIFNGLKATGRDCDLSMPEQYGVGIAHQVNDEWKIVADVLQVNWSSIDVFGTDPSLGVGGFGWEDQTLYKIGAEFKSSATMAWRIGYNYGKTPIPDENIDANLLAPAITESHLTFGLGTKAGSGDVNAYFAYVPENKQEDTGGLPKAKMNQYAIGVGYNASF